MRVAGRSMRTSLRFGECLRQEGSCPRVHFLFFIKMPEETRRLQEKVCGNPSYNGLGRYQQFLQKTLKVFPSSTSHPVPDGMHFVFDLLLFSVVVTALIGLLRRSRGEPPTTGPSRT